VEEDSEEDAAASEAEEDSEAEEEYEEDPADSEDEAAGPTDISILSTIHVSQGC